MASNKVAVRTFAVLWAGQLVSVLGSGLSGFATGVWVYQQTGSATNFALIALMSTIPVVLFGPVAGNVADRHNRRLVMLMADSGAALGTAAMWLLLHMGLLQVATIYPLVAFISVCSTFQAPAYDAAITQLVDKRSYKRIGGMLTLGPALANLSAPPLAGLLLPVIGLQGIFFIDLVTFVAAVLTIAAARSGWPDMPREKKAARSSWVASVLEGWNFLRARRALVHLLAYFVVLNCLIDMMSVLLTVMVLSFASPAQAGTVISLGGLGMLLGALWASIAKGTEQAATGVLRTGILFAAGMMLMGLRPSIFVIAAGMFLMLFMLPTMKAYNQVIWRRKVPVEMQGRVTALRLAVIEGTSPFVILVAGPLVDKVLDPLMMPTGALGPILGPLVGQGPGRGIGLLFLLLGLVFILLTLSYLANSSLQRMEMLLPDQT